MAKIQMMLMLNTWMMLMVIIMQLLMGKWMTCDKLSSGNGGCLIVNQAHTDTIDGAGLYAFKSNEPETDVMMLPYYT